MGASTSLLFSLSFASPGEPERTRCDYAPGYHGENSEIAPQGSVVRGIEMGAALVEGELVFVMLKVSTSMVLGGCYRASLRYSGSMRPRYRNQPI